MISPQSGTFQGDPAAAPYFLFLQHMTLELIEKYGGPGYPLPPAPLPPECEGPLPPPIPIKVFGYADDTDPIDVSLEGLIKSASIAILGESIQYIRNNGTKALIIVPPGEQKPVIPPAFLGLDAHGIFGPHNPTLMEPSEAFRYL